MRIFVISFEDLYQILEDLNKRFCLQRSLRIFYRSFKDLLKILVLKDLWQVFVNPLKILKDPVRFFTREIVTLISCTPSFRTTGLLM